MQILLPVLVVLGVATGCRDVQYPNSELTSSTIGGVGEVCVGVGSDDQHHKPRHNPAVDTNTDTDGKVQASVNSTSQANSSKAELTYGGFDRLQLALGFRALTWRGEQNSDEMWQYLLASYYHHAPPLADETAATETEAAAPSRRSLRQKQSPSESTNSHWQRFNKEDVAKDDTQAAQVGGEYEVTNDSDQRWGAFVLRDHIPEWVGARVVVKQSSLRMGVRSAYHELQRAYLSVQHDCTHMAFNGTFPLNQITETDTPSPSPSQSNRSRTHTHCPGLNALRFSLVPLTTLNDSSADADAEGSASIGNFRGYVGAETHTDENSMNSDHDNGNGVSASASPDPSVREEDLALVIQVFASMRANLTILTNVTTDHAAPIFLKELSPLLYLNLLEQQEQSSSHDNRPPSQNEAGGDDIFNEVRILYC